MCTPSRRLLSRTFKFASSAGAIAAVLALAGTASADEVFKAQLLQTLEAWREPEPALDF
jgi:hypothetical protein